MPEGSAPFFTLTGDQALQQLHATEKGLSSGEAAHRLQEYGPNQLPEKKGRSPFSMFLDQFKDFLILILIVAAVISAFLGEALDAAAILVVVVINAILGFTQEYRAEKAIESLKKLVAAQAVVLRDGVHKKIDVSELVPGDIVILEAGDKVPADCRLLETHALAVEEASLTGESVPVEKNASLEVSTTASIQERLNMVFMSTLVSRGKGIALVTSTGTDTQIGRVAQLVSEVSEESTPLQQKLEQLGKQLGVIALAITVVIFVLGILRGHEWFEMFFLSVSLAVAAIPEGLPAVVTVTLAIGVQRMVKRNAIIRKLPSVEGLGAATVICTDKTGTLTRNEMTVRTLYADGKDYTVTGEGYQLRGEILQGGKTVRPLPVALECALRTAALCNNASLSHEEEPVASIVGDPTEACLLVLGKKGGMDYQQEKQKRKLLEEFPFDSSRKMMSVVYLEKDGVVAYAKGAPEAILERSAFILRNGREEKISAEDKRKILAKNSEFASHALRVLALAYRSLNKKSKYSFEDAESGLVFVGLAGMIDPPREEAKQAVQLCKTAGIQVVVITGDNPETAKAIAVELGITSPQTRALAGKDLDAMTDEELQKQVKVARVYARVSPEHKLRIVSALQKNGEIVAMTGDGVNDAPSIKKADIGVSMGITGTEVAKESSDMVIADDNFASIVAAVEEGRVIYDNILKSVKYLLSCNIGEILVIFLAILLDFPTPLLPLQILWTNLITDTFPALALAMDPKDPAVMNRPPRNTKEEVLHRKNFTKLVLIGVIMAFATFGIFWMMLNVGKSIEAARAAAFSVLVISQKFIAWSFRSETHSLLSIGPFSNHWLSITILVGVLLQFAIVQTPYLESVFGTAALSAKEWGLVLLLSFIPFACLEVFKHVGPKRQSA